MKQSKTLRRWELALLLGVACAALLGVWLDGAQAALSDQVIRLHVLANSDSEADQALKLRVRDRILAEAEELFVPGAGRAETEELLRAHLYDLAAAGAEVVGEAGYSYPVTASLVHDYWFPTKTYTDFALPAGAYTALRIEIGAGGGQNWWCVLYPGLCRAACGGYALPEENDLVCGDYILRLRFVDWWNRHTASRTTRVLAG